MGCGSSSTKGKRILSKGEKYLFGEMRILSEYIPIVDECPLFYIQNYQVSEELGLLRASNLQYLILDIRTSPSTKLGRTIITYNIRTFNTDQEARTALKRWVQFKTLFFIIDHKMLETDGDLRLFLKGCKEISIRPSALFFILWTDLFFPLYSHLGCLEQGVAHAHAHAHADVNTHHAHTHIHILQPFVIWDFISSKAFSANMGSTHQFVCLYIPNLTHILPNLNNILNQWNIKVILIDQTQAKIIKETKIKLQAKVINFPESVTGLKIAANIKSNEKTGNNLLIVFENKNKIVDACKEFLKLHKIIDLKAKKYISNTFLQPKILEKIEIDIDFKAKPTIYAKQIKEEPTALKTLERLLKDLMKEQKNNKVAYSQSCAILLKLINNIQNNPNDLKFRTIKHDNQAFKEKLGKYNCSKNIMKYFGFSNIILEGEQKYTFGENMNITHLKNKKLDLEKVMKEI